MSIMRTLFIYMNQACQRIDMVVITFILAYSVQLSVRHDQSATRGIPVGEFVKGKVVVVTGSGGGIGRDMARVMAAHGARVVVNDLGKAAGTEQSAAEQ